MVVACGRTPVLVADGSHSGGFGSGHDDDGDHGDDGSHAQQCREVDFLFLIDNSAFSTGGGGGSSTAGSINLVA